MDNINAIVISFCGAFFAFLFMKLFDEFKTGRERQQKIDRTIRNVKWEINETFTFMSYNHSILTEARKNIAETNEHNFVIFCHNFIYKDLAKSDLLWINQKEIVDSYHKLIAFFAINKSKIESVDRRLRNFNNQFHTVLESPGTTGRLRNTTLKNFKDYDQILVEHQTELDNLIDQCKNLIGMLKVAEKKRHWHSSIIPKKLLKFKKGDLEKVKVEIKTYEESMENVDLTKPEGSNQSEHVK